MIPGDLPLPHGEETALGCRMDSLSPSQPSPGGDF